MTKKFIQCFKHSESVVKYFQNFKEYFRIFSGYVGGECSEGPYCCLWEEKKGYTKNRKIIWIYTIGLPTWIFSRILALYWAQENTFYRDSNFTCCYPHCDWRQTTVNMEKLPKLLPTVENVVRYFQIFHYFLRGPFLQRKKLWMNQSINEWWPAKWVW